MLQQRVDVFDRLLASKLGEPDWRQTRLQIDVDALNWRYGDVRRLRVRICDRRPLQFIALAGLLRLIVIAIKQNINDTNASK
jgi:hypothetical protein